ncbi:MAG TPA: IS91 family transposase [Chitinophagaceae bacterium]|nr:IS91 family transposase [Chitinophagaceae bacterium]
MKARFEVADVLKVHWPEIERLAGKGINGWQMRTLGAIKRCRTAELGGHVDACTSCGTVRISYNSCRNRHCPKCQGKEREKWIRHREEDLLPVPYFHVVFTLPDTLNPLAMHKPKEVYDSLFAAAWATIETFGKDPQHLGAQTGMICILHTWGQTMQLHPHLHCIVPGGGLSQSSRWKPARNQGKYLFPVKAMSKVFRAKYVEALRSRIPNLEKELVNALFKKDWVVYAKRPFAHPSHVVEYLGRYTHKIAISNHRIESIESKQVTFRYKDYRKESSQQTMTLEGMEFIRRFALHILPKGFVRIRHYGILSGSTKHRHVPEIRNQLGQGPPKPTEARKPEPYNPLLCPCCKTETIVTIQILPKRGPPAGILKTRNEQLKANL